MNDYKEALEQLIEKKDLIISTLCIKGMRRISDGIYSTPSEGGIDIGGKYTIRISWALVELANLCGSKCEFVHRDSEGYPTEMGDWYTTSVKGPLAKELDAAIAEQDKKRFMVFVPENGLAQKKPYSESTVEAKIDEGYCETVKSLPHTLECVWKGSNNILNYISGCLVDANRRGGLNQRLTKAIDDGRDYHGDACFIGIDDYSDSQYCGLPEYVADRILETLNGIKISERAKVNIGRVCYYNVKDAYDTLKFLKGSDNYKFLSQPIRDEIMTAFGNLEAALFNIDKERAVRDFGDND